MEAALVPSRQKLSDLEVQITPIVEEPEELPTYRRKLVTLLNMDIVSSTQMTQHLDPEDLLEFMDNALPRLVASVDSNGGHKRATREMGSKRYLVIRLPGKNSPNSKTLR